MPHVNLTLSLGLMSFLVGILVGLTSMGGAAFMTPFLLLVGGMRPVLAVGTDLAYSAITKIVGAGVHWRQKMVDVKIAFRLAMGSIPGGFLGFLTVRMFSLHSGNVDAEIKRAIGAVLCAGAAVTIVRAVWPRVFDAQGDFLRRHEVPATIVWGLLIGYAVGLTSVGSGSLIAPFLLLLYPNAPARMIGTDVFHAALLVSATAFLHSQAGNVEWAKVPVLLAGSIPGVMIGSYMAPRLPAKPLRIGLGVLLMVTGYKLV